MNQLGMSVVKQQDNFCFDWTGIPPVYGKCPGVKADGTIFSLPQLRLDSSRKDILDYFNNSWTLTEVLFSALAFEEAYYIRPYHKLRHPMIFYYGHVVSVYINKLRVAGLLDKALHADFEKLFEVGVDEMRWDDLHEGDEQIWPRVEQVRAYRQQAYHVIKHLIETHPLLEPEHLPITQDSPMWALVMGFEHERIHLETSSVLIREMPLELLRRPEAWPRTLSAQTKASKNQMLAVASGDVHIGKPHDYPTFGWDNEYGHETRVVRAFFASQHLISNQEFLEFVKAGGYAEEKFWSRDGWEWRRFRNVKWPTFWVQDGPMGSHLYKLRTIFELIELPSDAPVIVNFHEAKAFCAWKSEGESGVVYRLLTEAEHHAIRDDSKVDKESDFVSGGEYSVHAYMPNSKGFSDVFGNVWQWCEDHFHPLSGSKPHPYYDDFSSPCYDGEHHMILGGSFISTGDEASRYARFHFRPHFFQHAGFRVARSEDGNPACDAKTIDGLSASYYENREVLDRYLLMHWGSEHEIWDNVAKPSISHVVHLPLKCAQLVMQYAPNGGRALDIGCAVGRSTFEMARHFKEVVGLDYSKEFIQASAALQRDGVYSYSRKHSGGVSDALLAEVDSHIDRARVRFEQGDACSLPSYLQDFDAVLMSNVLCRLPDPAACLERMQGVNALVKRGGVLVMTTPFSWLEEYTAQARWLHGIEDIQRILSEYKLVYQEELPFVIRDHSRRFEYIITLASVWIRT